MVAHEAEATSQIFGYYTQLQAGYTPFRGLLGTLPVVSEHRGTLLEWEGGGYVRVATANNLKTGRGSSLRFLHLSEYAFWRDARTLMTGLMQSVPDDPDTVVIVESTANGVGGDFHRLWLEASDPTVETDWVPLFFAWYDHPEYTIRLEDPGAFEATLSGEERELAQQYNLTLGQLAWRRWAIRNKCQGSVEIFHQEYPCCPEEAFLHSGRPRFSLSHLAKMPVIEGAQVGELEEFHNGVKPVLAFLPKERGPLVVYKKPIQGHQYVAGIDVCEGIDATGTLGAADPDYTVVHIYDRMNGEQVAKLRCRLEPKALRPAPTTGQRATRTAVTDERRKVVDEAGEIAREIAPLRAKEKRLDALKKTIRGWAETDGIASDAAIAYRGARHVAAVAARENKRSFRSTRRLAKLLGKLFWAHATFPLKVWDELKLENKPTDLLVEERTGSRSVEFAPIAK